MGNNRSKKQEALNEPRPPEHARRIWTRGEFWSNVREGQHYAVKSSTAGIKYFHHFLIGEVHTYRQQVTVIHYYGTAQSFFKSGGKAFGKVMENNMEPGDSLSYDLLNVNSGLYVVDDPSYRKYGDPEKAVARARQRLNERSYDTLRNNCEHFVRWALTGESQSVQVDKASPLFKVVGEWVNEMKMVTYRSTMKCLRESLQGAAIGLETLIRGGTSHLKQMLSSATRGAASVSAGATFGLSLFLEVPFLLWSGFRKKRLADEGKITEQDFQSGVRKEAFVSGFSLVASAVGAAIGQFIFPFIGGIIGSLCGGVLARIVAPPLSRLIWRN